MLLDIFSYFADDLILVDFDVLGIRFDQIVTKHLGLALLASNWDQFVLVIILELIMSTGWANKGYATVIFFGTHLNLLF
ncbi:MAG: hypothetical protein CMF76_08520 [Maricaulis sp.]|nr:hypothetical protein [Maricaulis sp.]